MDRADEYRRRAERMEQRAAKFEAGAEGERLVAAALAKLVTVGYRVIDDVAWPGTTHANIDHVAYGPTGMYVVDAKFWNGEVAVRKGVLRQNGYSRARETDKVATMTDVLQDHLGASVGKLTPVLCLAHQPNTEATWCGRTLVVGLDRLTPWIFRRPEVWPESHSQAVENWLPSMLQPATGRRPQPAEPRGRHQAD